MTRAWAQAPRVAALLPRIVGTTVDRVESRGKHLLMWFDRGRWCLHTHMRMTGSWHTYQSGERWRQPRGHARVVVETTTVVAVCFAAPTVELLSAPQVARHPTLTALGPDALAARTDLQEARRRLDTMAQRSIADALRNQRVLAGLGNVYVNEVLFAHRVHPATPVAAVPDEARDALLATAERLLKVNVASGGRRMTTGSASRPLAVYGRRGRPCPRCGTPIATARRGDTSRHTFWCPRCQPSPGH